MNNTDTSSKYESFKQWLEKLLTTVDIPNGISYRLYDSVLYTLSDSDYTVYSLQILTHYDREKAVHECQVHVPTHDSATLSVYSKVLLHATNLTLLANLQSRAILTPYEYTYDTHTPNPNLDRALRSVLQAYFYALPPQSIHYTPLLKGE